MTEYDIALVLDTTAILDYATQTTVAVSEMAIQFEADDVKIAVPGLSLAYVLAAAKKDLKDKTNAEIYFRTLILAELPAVVIQPEITSLRDAKAYAEVRLRMPDQPDSIILAAMLAIEHRCDVMTTTPGPYRFDGGPDILLIQPDF